MALTINTNISSLIAQRNLELATSALNTSIERMTTGFKINHAGDNAAGHSIATLWKTHIGSLDVASDNAAMGADLLTTAEESYSLLIDHIQRVRDLTEQAANGTYGTNSLKAIRSEIEARLSEVDRIVNNTEFNGIKLLNGTAGEIKLQVGLYNNDYSQITLVESLFDDAGLAELFQSIGGFTGDDAESIAQECSGLASDNVTISAQAPKLDCLDKILANLSERPLPWLRILRWTRYPSIMIPRL